MDQKSLIDFCSDSSDLICDVLDGRKNRGAELSTYHYLVVCFLATFETLDKQEI